MNQPTALLPQRATASPHHSPHPADRPYPGSPLRYGAHGYPPNDQPTRPTPPTPGSGAPSQPPIAAGSTGPTHARHATEPLPGSGTDQQSGEARQPLRPSSPFERALPELRGRVANRLAKMNWEHARKAWELRRRDPIGPHVLAFLFAEPPGGEPPRCELRIAARLFLAADESRLPMLLHEMVGVTRDVLNAGGDPRVDLANWCDDMTPHAAYIGLAVSSLDTPTGRWTQVRKAAHGEMDIPGRCYSKLVDGSQLLIDRLAKQHFGRIETCSTRFIAEVSDTPHLRWKTDPDAFDPEHQDQNTQDLWQWLDQLHQLLARGSRAQ